MGSEYEELIDLIRRVRGGELQAFGQIVLLTQDAVTAVTRSVLRKPQDVEDAVQETYLRAYRRLGELEDAQAFVAWLKQIARNCALDRKRSRVWVELEGEVEEEQVQAGESDERRLQQQALARAITALSPENRRLFEGYYVAQRSTASIAGQMGITDAAVRKRLERIRQQLRQEIDMSAKPGLPDRIIEMLSRPILTDIPENPVGAVWDSFRAAFREFEVVTLPEEIELAALERAVGPTRMAAMPKYVHRIDQGKVLRSELDLALLAAVGGRPAPLRLVTAGTVYRNCDEDATHLQVFHQADLLLIEPGADEWSLVQRLIDWVQTELGVTRMMIERTTFHMSSDRCWELAIRRNENEPWLWVAAWARLADDVMRRLGHDPAQVQGTGMGMGLERIACMRYGIDDIRKVVAWRVE